MTSYSGYRQYEEDAAGFGLRVIRWAIGVAVVVGLAHLALNHVPWLTAQVDRAPATVALPGGGDLPLGTLLRWVAHPAGFGAWYTGWIQGILARFPQG